MHQNKSLDWSSFQLCTEDGFKRRLAHISIGDLPPKSPEFSNMLPSLRPSPVFLSRTDEDAYSESFHVVPTSYKANMDTEAENDTYGQFIKQLEREEIRCFEQEELRCFEQEEIRCFGRDEIRCFEREEFRGYDNSLTFSPQEFAVPGSYTDPESCEDLSGGEDLEIYLPSEISPTPVENLYSTLQNEHSPKTFAFPAFDENQRLENYDIYVTPKQGIETIRSCTPVDKIVTTVTTARNQSAPRTINTMPQKRKSDIYARKESFAMTKKQSRPLELQLITKVEKPTHNDIERQRRNDMKGRFDALKGTIPDIQSTERTPKILILSKAADFINQLHAEETRLDTEKETERWRNRALLERLVALTNI